MAARHRDLLFLAGVVHVCCALNVGISPPQTGLKSSFLRRWMVLGGEALTRDQGTSVGLMGRIVGLEAAQRDGSLLSHVGTCLGSYLCSRKGLSPNTSPGGTS